MVIATKFPISDVIPRVWYRTLFDDYMLCCFIMIFINALCVVGIEWGFIMRRKELGYDCQNDAGSEKCEEVNDHQWWWNYVSRDAHECWLYIGLAEFVSALLPPINTR